MHVSNDRCSAKNFLLLFIVVNKLTKDSSPSYVYLRSNYYLKVMALFFALRKEYDYLGDCSQFFF